MLPQGPDRREPVCLRHVQVDEGGIEHPIGGRFDRLLGVFGGSDLTANVPQIAREHVSAGRVVIDQQQPLPGQRALIGLQTAARRLLERDVQPERRATAHGARHADSASHELDELLRNGKTEAGSTIAAGYRTVFLREGFEDPLEIRRVDADASVHDADADAGLSIERQLFCANDDLTAIGELHGVGREVENNLPDPDDVADTARRHRLTDVAQQLQSLGIRLLRE